MTMVEDDTLAAATTLLRNLAKGATPVYQPSEHEAGAANGPSKNKVSLPGLESVTKRAFEKELGALQARVQYLEAKASTVNSPLPDTPGELEPTTPGFDNPPSTSSSPSSSNSVPTRQQSASSARHARISDLLAARDHGSQKRRSFSEEELGHLRDHVEKQSEEIRVQRETIANIGRRLSEQQDQTERTFCKVEHEDIGKLQRELQKHQQANEAFQKALKEIGTIITNVANGDLSHKVLIHTVEMDPEITTFKMTINTMMDQLQVFGSEVSRVAREVGTEGILGGQAQITGVSGIWAELTQNGKNFGAKPSRSRRNLTGNSQ